MCRFVSCREAFHYLFTEYSLPSRFRVYFSSGYYWVIHDDEVEEFLDERRHFSDVVEEVI